MEPCQEYFGRRTVLVMVLLIISCWTGARLKSREQYQWIPLLIGPANGAVIGAVYQKGRGAVIGAGIGLGMAGLLILFDCILWLVFTLPPHPKVDL